MDLFLSVCAHSEELDDMGGASSLFLAFVFAYTYWLMLVMCFCFLWPISIQPIKHTGVTVTKL